MSIESLIDELKSADSFHVVEIREKIQREFKAAKTSEQRAAVLAIFKTTMDDVERHLTNRGGQPEILANFKAARAYDYKSLIYEECLVGGDSPGGGDVSVEMLMAVTNREIAAGRMAEDHSTRQMAVKCTAAPHLSHAELVAKHAKLEERLSRAEAASTPNTPPGSTSRPYAFGVVLGRKLKGLFRN